MDKCDIIDECSIEQCPDHNDVMKGNCINEHRDGGSCLLRQMVQELEAEVEALTECLNGSSKAVYTAEVFDKMRGELEQRIKELEEAIKNLIIIWDVK
jgi:hypothetical protein